jgi:hypothetical protein
MKYEYKEIAKQFLCADAMRTIHVLGNIGTLSLVIIVWSGVFEAFEGLII